MLENFYFYFVQNYFPNQISRIENNDTMTNCENSKEINERNPYIISDFQEKRNILRNRSDLISLLKIEFKYLEDDLILNLYNFLEINNCHFFEFINSFFLFDKISKNLRYYKNLIKLRKFKSRDFDNDYISEFYNQKYNSDFIYFFKNFKTFFLEDELDEYTDFEEIKENKREFKIDSYCKKKFFNFLTF